MAERTRSTVWDDIQGLVGSAVSAPADILGSVVQQPGLRSLANTLGPAYAAGQGRPELAMQMRARQREQQKHAALTKSMEEAYPGGSGFSPYDMKSANHFRILAGRAGYGFMEAMQMLEQVGKAMAPQTTSAWKTITIPTASGDRVVRVNPETGETRELTGPGADQGTPYTPPKYSEIGPLMDAWDDSKPAENLTIISERLAQIEAAFADALKSGNPLAFTSSVTNLAKILDQQGVVREADFAVIDQTQAILDRFKKDWESKGSGKIDVENTPIMQNILSQARLLSRSAAEVALESYARRQDTFRRGVVDRQPEGHRVYDLKDFRGINPRDLIERIDKSIGSSAPTGGGQPTTPGMPEVSETTPTSRVDSQGREIRITPDGREVVWEE